MNEEERLRKILTELIEAVKVVQRAPAVLLVTEGHVEVDSDEYHETPVTQAFIDALWNEAIAVTERAEAALTIGGPK